MNRLVRTLAAAALGLAALATVAQDSPPTRPERREGGPERREGGPGGPGGGRRPRPSLLMQALDTDNDGELSAAEIANAVAALKKLDKNGDGKLSADELRPPAPEGERRGPNAGNAAEALARLMAFDKNGDGKLSADEMPERMRNIVTRADTDKNGFASKEELAALLAAQARNERGGPGGRGGDEDERPRPRRDQDQPRP
jgi:Ca2+-binding EF-hand superfamily protein